MNRAIVKERFFGAPDDDIYPRWYEVGDVITGDLAIAEVENGRAFWEGQKSEKKPPRNMAIDKPERNKLTLSSPQGQASQEKTVKRRRGRPRKS